jgi:hypothetical protein
MRVKKALRKKEALDEKKMTKGDIAALKHPREKITGDDLAALRAGEHKMEESDVTSPSSMGIKPDYASGTPDYANRGPQMVNRAAKTSAPAGTVSGTVKEEISDKEKKASKIKAILKRRMGKEGSESISQSRRQDLEEKKMTNAEMAKREKIVRSLKPVSKWEKRYPGRGEEVMYATATKQAMKEENEGFNGRHNLSVNASVQEQVVAEQTRARSDYGVGAIPAQKNAAQRRAALDARMEKGIDTVAPFIPGVGAARAIDKYARGQQGLGQTAADVGLNLAGGAILKGIGKGYQYGKAALQGKRAAQTGSQSASAASKSASSFTPTPKPTQTYANAADELSPATKERMSKYLDRRMGGGSSSTAKPTSRGAAREPDEIIPPNRSATPSGNAGIRGTFRDNLAKARQNAGSDPKARQLPALRRTTEPTNYVRPGVPAVRPASGANLPARPGMPNLAAGGATRVVGLSNKAKAGLGAGAAGAALTGYAMTRGNQPSATQAATSTAQGPSFEKTGRGSAPSLPATSTAQGPSYEKTGRGSAPSLPAKQPASSAASASASAPPQAPAQPVRKAAPQDSSTPAQRAQFNRQIDRGIAAPGTQYKGLGVKTGTTIKQAPAPAVKRPVGTGREK